MHSLNKQCADYSDSDDGEASLGAVTNSLAGDPVHVGGYGPSRHWPAGLYLGFQYKAGKTILSDMRFKGPLRVQRPFYPENEVCHIYLLHPPGGLVSGDDVQISMAAEKGSHALVTTPSAGKFYRADSHNVVQTQSTKINVVNACIEWLPQETIVFDGANGLIDTVVELHGESRFIGWDIFCLGRTAGNFPFENGRLTQKLSVFQDDKPLLLERQHIDLTNPESTAGLSAFWGYQNQTVSGTLFATGFAFSSDVDKDALVDKVRLALGKFLDDTCDTSEGVMGEENIPKCFSVTWRRDVLVVRYLGNDSEQAKKLFELAWRTIRPVLMGREAETPRIWRT